jgi:hypothetical protein
MSPEKTTDKVWCRCDLCFQLSSSHHLPRLGWQWQPMLSQSGAEPWISAEQCVLEQAPNLAPKLKTVQLKGKAIKSTNSGSCCSFDYSCVLRARRRCLTAALSGGAVAALLEWGHAWRRCIVRAWWRRCVVRARRLCCEVGSCRRRL